MLVIIWARKLYKIVPSLIDFMVVVNLSKVTKKYRISLQLLQGDNKDHLMQLRPPSIITSSSLARHIPGGFGLSAHQQSTMRLYPISMSSNQI